MYARSVTKKECSERSRQRTLEKRKAREAEKAKTDMANGNVANVVPLVVNDKSGDDGLAKFSPRELMAELFKRGYRGKLTYTCELDIASM